VRVYCSRSCACECVEVVSAPSARVHVCVCDVCV